MENPTTTDVGLEPLAPRDTPKVVWSVQNVENDE